MDKGINKILLFQWKGRDNLAELKTKQNDRNVKEFLNTLTDDKKREDSFKILELMKSVAKEEPKMWGNSIIGFGSYHYKYESGRESDWFLTGFSPRKQNLAIYIMPGFSRYSELLKKLGKHSIGKSCLYIKKLEDIDMEVLRELVEQSVLDMKK